MITLGLVDSVDDNGVYVTMPGSRGVLRGPYKSLSTVAAGTTVLVASTDDGEQVVVGPVGGGHGMYNVRSFGATGDGATDDSDAFHAALAACSDDGGGVVIVPAGRYRITERLTVTDGVTVAGAGKSPATGAPTYLDFTDCVDYCIFIDDGSDIVLRDFYLGGPGGVDDIIHVRGSSRRITLERLIVNGGGTTGVGVQLGHTESVIQSTVQQVTVVSCGTGLSVSQASTSVGIRDCYVNANSIGYKIYGTYIALQSCAADSNTLYGYVLQDANAVTLTSCGSEVNDRTGFLCTGATHVTFLGCRGVGNNADADAYFPSFLGINDSSDHITVVGCVDTSPESGTTHSIKTFSGSAGPNVSVLNSTFPLTVVGVPDVSGSRGGNAALASLLTTLESLGLITDSSS